MAGSSRHSDDDDDDVVEDFKITDEVFFNFFVLSCFPFFSFLFIFSLMGSIVLENLNDVCRLSHVQCLGRGIVFVCLFC